MRKVDASWTIGLAMAVAGTGLVLLVGTSCAIIPVDVDSCAIEDAQAAINVNGVYRYSGEGANQESGASFGLSGTITFEQDGNRVRVTDTTYDFAGLRRVDSGFAELQGNRLALVMTPINGDRDYIADVTFIFDDGGDTFCVAFEDTNNDAGDLGSFRGVRQSQN